MLQVTLDTSCVVNLLSARERSPSDLLRLVRLALDGHIRIGITDVVDKEIPEEQTTDDVQRRAYIREKLRQFPDTDISLARRDERDALAAQLMRLLWPRANAGSRRHANSSRDCLHLASHLLCGRDIFVTLDQELARKAKAKADKLGLRVLTPTEALKTVEPPPPALADSGRWNPVVQRARQDDLGEIKSLLAPIRDSYEDFDSWLASSLLQKELWVARLDDQIGAVAVWSMKTRATVKLATFFVGDSHRGCALGPHLLFHQLRHWIAMGVQKAFVTVSSERLEALSFFLEYGFRIEGSSARRYKSSAVEFVLAKHLFYRVVADEDFDAFLTEFGSQVFDLPDHPDVRAPGSWFMPPRSGVLSSLCEENGRTTGVQVLHGSAIERALSIEELEELAYPARFALRGRKAYMVPIQPRWADSMMDVPRAQLPLFGRADKLSLRNDNTYYCHPSYPDDALCGAPALFYVSRPDRMVAGFARIIERTIAEPEDLFLRYERTGIYELENIRRHIKTSGKLQGCAMAIRFSWWVPFRNPVHLAKLRDMGRPHPQRIKAIEFADYEQLLAAGGIDW